MAAEKLSISLEASLARIVRSAAAEEGVTVSTWLAEAAKERARQLALRTALDAMDERFGPMSLEDARRIVADTRKKSIVVRPRRKRT